MNLIVAMMHIYVTLYPSHQNQHYLHRQHQHLMGDVHTCILYLVRDLVFFLGWMSSDVQDTGTFPMRGKLIRSTHTHTHKCFTDPQSHISSTTSNTHLPNDPPECRKTPVSSPCRPANQTQAAGA